MRLPYRNKKVTLWVLFGIIVVTMFLFKFTELRPNCLFKLDPANDVAPQMVPFEVCTKCRVTHKHTRTCWCRHISTCSLFTLEDMYLEAMRVDQATIAMINQIVASSRLV